MGVSLAWNGLTAVCTISLRERERCTSAVPRGTPAAPGMCWRTASFALLLMILSPRAEAIPLRVVTASELQIAPRVAANRASVEFALHLQDDRRAPLARRAVRVQVQGSSGRVLLTTEATTDRAGEASVVVPLSPQERALTVTGEFSGDRAASAASQTLRVSPDAPFVTLELVLDPVVNLGDDPVRAVVTVHVGEVVPLSAGDLSVDLVVGDRTIATGITDVSGRATLEIPSAQLGEPGVRRVRPRVSLGPEMIVGSERNLVVRARTALTMESSVSSDAAGPVRLVGALSTPRSPVRDAPIRIMFGGRAITGARTDARGVFEALVPSEVLVEHDVAVRAVFDPTEPWYEGSSSPLVTLTAAAPPRIGWKWLLSPLALAALGVAGFWLRSLRVTPPAPPPRPSTTLARGAPQVERIAAVRDGVVRVKLEVFDHASGQRIAGGFVRASREDPWVAIDPAGVVLSGGRKMALEVGAEGFSPRAVEATLPGPGEYAVRVTLKTWREELFERARAWLRRTPRGVGVQTPREALASSPEKSRQAEALVELVEQGCYGPEAPGQREVARADELIASLRAGATQDPRVT